MLIAAIDTTARAGSYALVRDGSVLALRAGDASRPHATRLPGELLDMLALQHLALADVDAFAVAAGPGSFTGLRIGMAAIQGLAFATGRPAVGVPALEALAHAAVSDASRAALRSAGPMTVAAWMDAQREEVFAARYQCQADGDGPTSVVQLDAPIVAAPAEVLDRWHGSDRVGTIFVGDGTIAYRHLLIAAGIPATALVVPTPATAPSVAALAAALLAAGGTFHPHALVPIYVRRSDAELARDRRATTGP